MKRLPCFKLRVVFAMELNFLYVCVASSQPLLLVLLPSAASVACVTMLLSLVIALRRQYWLMVNDYVLWELWHSGDNRDPQVLVTATTYYPIRTGT